MSPVLLHLLFVVAGVAVVLGALWYFARVRGGWLSMAGLFTAALLVVGGALILAGFGVVSFPGLDFPATPTTIEGAAA